MSPDSFEKEARMAMAVKLFEIGRITSGQAAELADISRVKFLLNCQEYGAASIEWDEEEIESELRELGK